MNTAHMATTAGRAGTRRAAPRGRAAAALAGLTAVLAAWQPAPGLADVPVIADPSGRCVFRPDSVKTVAWQQGLPACMTCEQVFAVDFSTRQDFATLDHGEGAHFLSATQFFHQFDDGWRPNMRHCVRVQRTYPTLSVPSDPACWIAGFPRAPDAPVLTGSRDGLASNALNVDFSESAAACEYHIIIARDPGLMDVTKTVSMADPQAHQFDDTTEGTATSLGRRFYWTACGVSPLDQRACAPPRAWTDPYGEECAQIGVSSGIGVGGESVAHLDTCTDEVYPAPNGYGTFLRDRSKTLLAAHTGRHYHSGGTMSGAASIDTNDYRHVEVPGQDPWAMIRSTDHVFDSDDPIERDGVTVHYNTGLAYEAIRDLVGYVPRWPHPTLGCNSGNGIVSYVGTDELVDLPCRDQAAWSDALFSVNYCVPGPKGIDFAADIDVTAHELGHALVQCNSHLAADRAYGSLLNEFFGDAVATAVAARTQRGGDIWLNADRAVAGGLRDLRDPSLKQQPSVFEGPYWKSFASPECQSGDCFHHNATVPGHMFYLLANGGTDGLANEITVPGIGLDRAFSIVAKAEATYWTAHIADLPTARDGMVAAAQELFGSDAASAVDTAWRAVNVSGGGAPPPTPRPTPTPGRCGGDCNQDGVVTIDEIVTVVRAILADTPDPSTCPALDANDNGEISISDAVAAVLNALNACGGEARLAAGTTADARGTSIEVGSAFAPPGGTATVDLRLRGAPADTVAFQAEILLPPGITMSSCRGADRLRHQVTALALPASPAADAAQRVRIIGIDLEDNTNPLGDGTLATCSFRISRDARYGPLALTLRWVGLSSSRAVPTTPEALSGVVTVTECDNTLQIGCVSETTDPRDGLKIRAGKKVDWRWQTPRSIESGDPASQHFRFCVYDTDAGGLRLIAAMDVPPSSDWRSISQSGHRYENRALGIRRVELRRTGSGGLRLRVQGMGPMSLPPLPLAQTGPVAVELGSEQACWLALYRSPARLNDGRSFYDTND